MSDTEQSQSSAGRFVKAVKRGATAAWRRHAIERLGPLEDVTITLPRSGAVYRVTKPVDIDSLLNLAESDPEENLPYWAALWPSGIALADSVLAEPELIRGKRVLEIGTGLGITAIAAVTTGADLTISDYSDEALRLAAYNIEQNGLKIPASMQMNWRSPSDPFRSFAGEGFSVVLAADVLYEQRDVEPLLEIVDWLVAPGGMLWLAEPRRYAAGRFVDLIDEAGWDGDVELFEGPWPEMEDTGVKVRVHKLFRP